MPDTFDTLEIERQGAVLRVWLAAPERRNAVTQQTLRELGDLFLSLETDFETRVVVLGGRGPSFCAGMNRRPDATPAPERERGDRGRRWVSQLGRRTCRAIEDCEVLTVARVHGHAVGGGCCFALACDFRIAAEDAIFSLPEVELGVPLSWGAVPRLIQEIGAARAREMLLMCSRIDGRRAAELGLAHRAVPEAELDAEVERWLEALLAKPELAVHQTKTQLRGYARAASLGDATEGDGDMIGMAFRSESFRSRFGLKEES